MRVSLPAYWVGVVGGGDLNRLLKGLLTALAAPYSIRITTKAFRRGAAMDIMGAVPALAK